MLGFAFSPLWNPKTHFIRFEDPSFKRSFKIEQRTQKISLSRLATNIVFVSADSP